MAWSDAAREASKQARHRQKTFDARINRGPKRTKYERVIKKLDRGIKNDHRTINDMQRVIAGMRKVRPAWEVQKAQKQLGKFSKRFQLNKKRALRIRLRYPGFSGYKGIDVSRGGR